MLLKINQKIKSRLRPLAFYIKARPVLFRTAVAVLKLFPKLDHKIRAILSNDLIGSPRNAVDMIVKVENNMRLKALYAMKIEIEMIKQRKL